MGRCASSTRRSRPCWLCFERTICCSSPPTTATIRRRRRPTTPRMRAAARARAVAFVRRRSARRPTFSDLGATVGRMARRRVPRPRNVVPLATGRSLGWRSISGRALELTGDERTLTILRERAFAAMERAYAPYSNFRVGAALLVVGRKHHRRVQRRERGVPGGHLRRARRGGGGGGARQPSVRGGPDRDRGGGADAAVRHVSPGARGVLAAHVVVCRRRATDAKLAGRSTNYSRKHLPRTHWTGDEPERSFCQ